jgi:hypothetical protein
VQSRLARSVRNRPSGRVTPAPNRYDGRMPKRSRKRPRDVNRMAAEIVDEATGNTPPVPDPDEGKDPAAVALGRKGGLKGGKARAAKMSAKQRSEAARRAAQARWGSGRK